MQMQKGALGVVAHRARRRHSLARCAYARLAMQPKLAAHLAVARRLLWAVGVLACRRCHKCRRTLAAASAAAAAAARATSCGSSA